MPFPSSSLSETRTTRVLREMRATWLLALPIVLGQLSSVGMGVLDTVLAGRHGQTTLAAVAIGSAVWSIVLLVLIGVLMAVPPAVSQLNGAMRRAEIGAIFRQALWLALALGLGLFVLVHVGSSWLLTAMRIPAEVESGALAFLHAIAWGSPAMALYLCFRYLSEGVAWSPPTMLFGFAGLVLLLPLGYALMFGAWGMPELGAAGLGWATTTILWVQAAGFAAYLRFAPRYADLQLFARFDPPRRAPIAELLRIGLPMGVTVFFEGALFVATALVIGRLGTLPIAAHQIAINLATVAFMLPLGLAMATTVRVGHAAGAGDASAVRRAAGAGYVIVLITQTGSAALMVFCAGWLARLYTSDPAVIALASTLLAYAAAFQYPDGIQALSNGVLRGLKDTRAPMAITLVAYWCIGMPLGSWLGLGMGWGPRGMWWGLIVGLAAAAALLAARVHRLIRSDDRLMSVVETGAKLGA
jgi:MATE family multidrug resistance protein